MLDYRTLLGLIQEDRRREVAAAERARMVGGRARLHRAGIAAPARRSVGRVLVRFGAWLAMFETPSTFQG